VKKGLPRRFEDLIELRARGLIRESTEEQGERSGPEVQRREERAFAARWGLQFDEERFYTDFRTGSDARKRPEFLQMIDDAKSGLFDVLLVYDTSRFGRNWREVGHFERELHAAGVCVAYIYENALSSGHDQIQMVVNHAVNEDWLDKHREKVRLGVRVNRFEKGKWSGTPPLGYRMGYEAVFNPKKGMVEPVETGILEPDTEPQPRVGHGDTYTRADLARLIGELYASGRVGARGLAAHLNAQGYRNAKGEPFSGGSIRHILESPALAGWLSWHQRADKRLKGEEEERVRGPHMALWTDELW